MMIHRRYADAPPLGVAASAMLVTTAALVVPASLAPPTRIPDVLVGTALVVLGVVCTGATLVLFYTLIASTGPARAALAFYLSPAFAVALGVMLLHDRITPTAVVGLVAVVAGSILAAHRPEPLRGEHPHT